ncbi:MAG: transposase, partial [Candidatus Brocadia sp.]
SGSQVENFIKELSYEFYIDKVNSQGFTANGAFMTIKCTAYNIVQCFKQQTMKDVWQTRSLKTITKILSWVLG